MPKKTTSKHRSDASKSSPSAQSGGTPEPSELELQILGVLWQKKTCTAREVLRSLTDGKERAYTTVLSTMQGMHRKGLIDVTGEKQKLAHIYKPLVTRRQIVRPKLRNLVQRVFGGSGFQAAMGLMKESDLSAEELDEMAAWLKKKRKKKSGR